jgi:FkbM family methyltransferase
MGFWKAFLPQVIWNPLNEFRRDYFPNCQKSYSGEGEDLILLKIFGRKLNGFYIDVGCYHPKINSNTYALYKIGWRGINIDANPQSIKKFEHFRKDDININMGIANQRNTMAYYTFNEPAVNTFSQTMFEERRSIPWLKYLGEKSIPVEPLREVLSRVDTPDTIDILDVDVEGFDMEVLISNDWSRYVPRVVLVEDQYLDVKSYEELETYKFLVPKGYSLLAKTLSTLIFIHRDHLQLIK